MDFLQKVETGIHAVVQSQHLSTFQRTFCHRYEAYKKSDNKNMLYWKQVNPVDNNAMFIIIIESTIF